MRKTTKTAAAPAAVATTTSLKPNCSLKWLNGKLNECFNEIVKDSSNSEVKNYYLKVDSTLMDGKLLYVYCNFLKYFWRYEDKNDGGVWSFYKNVNVKGGRSKRTFEIQLEGKPQEKEPEKEKEEEEEKPRKQTRISIWYEALIQVEADVSYLATLTKDNVAPAFSKGNRLEKLRANKDDYLAKYGLYLRTKFTFFRHLCHMHAPEIVSFIRTKIQTIKGWVGQDTRLIDRVEKSFKSTSIDDLADRGPHRDYPNLRPICDDIAEIISDVCRLVGVAKILGGDKKKKGKKRNNSSRSDDEIYEHYKMIMDCEAKKQVLRDIFSRRFKHLVEDGEYTAYGLYIRSRYFDILHAKGHAAVFKEIKSFFIHQLIGVVDDDDENGDEMEEEEDDVTFFIPEKSVLIKHTKTYAVRFVAKLQDFQDDDEPTDEQLEDFQRICAAVEILVLHSIHTPSNTRYGGASRSDLKFQGGFQASVREKNKTRKQRQVGKGRIKKAKSILRQLGSQSPLDEFDPRKIQRNQFWIICNTSVTKPIGQGERK